MSSIRLKFVHQWIDRRHGSAKVRYYFRRDGFKRMPLPGLPGSSEFMRAYETALAGQALPRPAIGAGRTKEGSIGALVVAYFCSPQFLALAPATRQTYRLILEKFRHEHGSKPLALLTRRHINDMLARRVGTPAAANHWLRLVKTLMAFAVKEEFRADNPAAAVDRIKNRTDGFHSWTEEEIAQFEVRYPIGTKARLASALGLYTAQRRSDVVRMGRQHIIDGTLAVRQQKTRTTLSIPVHHELAHIIAASSTGNLTFLVTEYGRPFTAAGFGGWWRKRCDEAGLPKECGFHGLRKAACTRLAEAGCAANVIAAISGHKTLREVERYTKAADQKRMAAIGMAAIRSRT